MSDWFDKVAADGGWNCGACQQWRVLNGREIEECPNCHDDAFDVYEFVAEYEMSKLP